MPDLEPSAVRAADDAWTWVPDDAETVDTDDYLLVLYPTYLEYPTQVVRTHSDRSPSELVPEVLAAARERGRPHVVWWVSDATSPSGLEAHLVDAGAEQVERLSALARSLDPPAKPVAPTPASPADDEPPEIRLVADRATVVDAHQVEIEAFSGEMPPDEVLDRETAELAATDRTSWMFVAYVDGRPAGLGGVDIVDGVARLFNGSTVPWARRRGVYGAVLRTRLDWARERGARFALTRGRVETSAPLLRRQGFEVYGERRAYRIPA